MTNEIIEKHLRTFFLHAVENNEHEQIVRKGEVETSSDYHPKREFELQTVIQPDGKDYTMSIFTRVRITQNRQVEEK